MKIKKLVNYNTKLTTLNLIETKILNKKIISENLTIEKIKYQLKKALQIIYKYHLKNKKILFIGGTELKILKKLNNSGHCWISEDNWLNGLLTNDSKRQNPREKRPQHQKKYNLLVILGDHIDNFLQESYTVKIPTIYFKNTVNCINRIGSYKIEGNFKLAEKVIRNNFFYALLETTLKKANYIKNSQNNRWASKKI